MDPFKYYQQAKRVLSDSQNWFALIGAEYSGGCRSGVRERGRITSINVQPTVYHQAYDGATNYHEAPKELQAALEKVVIRRFSELYAEAITILHEEKAKAAKEAHEAYTDIANEITT